MKSIDRPGNRRYPLDLHIDYQERIFGVVSVIDPEKLCLEEADIETWRTNIQTENDVARESRAAKESDGIKEKDAERNKLITVLFQEIRQAAQSPLFARQEAGRLLKVTVDAFKGLQRMRLSGKTAQIESLLFNLSTPEAAIAMNLLEITSVADLLRTANDEFKALREARSKAVGREDLPTAQSIRSINDKFMDEVFRHIEAAYMAAKTDEDQRLIDNLINQINRRTRESKTTYKRSEAMRKKKLLKQSGTEADRAPESPAEISASASDGQA